jgi:biotin carboxylase
VEGGPANGRRRVLVLGAGPAQLGLLQTARKNDLYVIAVDRDPAAPGFRYADRRAIISAEDESGIDRLATAEHVDGLIAPGIDFPVAIAARIAERLALPHPIDPATAVLATNKLRQRERLAQTGVPHARSRACTTLEEAKAAAAEVGFPCVVKAPDRQGQKGIAYLRRATELPEAFARAQGAARGNVVLVEEYVEGRELTVNAFSVGGRFHALTVTDRVVAEPPAFGVALAHVYPSAEETETAVAAAAGAAEALEIREGPTYTQVLLGEDGARVGELAARLGGGHDAELCQSALGVDLNGLALSAALGDEIDAARVRPVEERAAVVRFLVAAPGLLETVEGVEEAEAMEGVEWARSYRETGYIFVPLRRGADRAGAVLAVGADREEALQRAEAAAERIRFQTLDAEALVHP